MEVERRFDLAKTARYRAIVLIEYECTRRNKHHRRPESKGCAGLSWLCAMLPTPPRATHAMRLHHPCLETSGRPSPFPKTVSDHREPCRPSFCVAERTALTNRV